MTAVGYFLINLLFSIAIFILWLRIALTYFKISALNPISQLIHTLTDPIIGPLYQLFKIKNRQSLTFDWVSFSVLVIVEFIKFFCIALIIFQSLASFHILLIFVLADLIIQPCDLLFYAIIIRVIMSYANPGWRHPLNDFLIVVTEPLLRFGRKIVPDISGFDFSPFIIMIILKVITLFISSYLPWRML